jgi:uncharacterized protein
VWLVDPALRRRIESALATELELAPGEAFLDYPEKARMMDLDLLLRHRDGSVGRLGESGRAGLIDLPRVAGDLYRSARALRLFTAERRRVAPERLMRLLDMDRNSLERRLADGGSLL